MTAFDLSLLPRSAAVDERGRASVGGCDLAELAQTYVACVPNAGLPDEDGHYLESPAMVAGVLERFVNEGWINVVGGCCGTTEQHVAALSAMVAGRCGRDVCVPSGPIGASPRRRYESLRRLVTSSSSSPNCSSWRRMTWVSVSASRLAEK